MDITRAQQIALDDALVAPINRLTIGKNNLRLSLDLKSKEPTLQVVYDVLKHTPFYKAFQITSDVPEIYIAMLKICPKLPDQQFKEPPFEEEILTFLKDLGHSGEIKEDFVYQVENKNFKRSNEMYYPRFTKVIINFFMTKDPLIPRRNRLYGAILLDELTNEAIKDSESYKEYYAIASGAEPPKTKASVKKKQDGSDKTKTPPTAKGKRLKTLAKVAKPAKQKQPAKSSKAKGADEGTSGKLGVPDVLTYESDDEQISWKSSDEEDDDEVVMSEDADDNDDDVDDAENQDDDGQDDDGQEYHRKDDEGQEDDNEQTDSDNNGDEFVPNKREETGFKKISIRVQTPSHYESTDDDGNDEVNQGTNVAGEDMDKKKTNEEEKVNELYRDVNVNLEGRDTKMTNANAQATQIIEDTHVIITTVNPEVQQ
ncbi:hypothetical protein Tco_0064347 [Tanacetum coccineum]